MLDSERYIMNDVDMDVNVIMNESNNNALTIVAGGRFE